MSNPDFRKPVNHHWGRRKKDWNYKKRGIYHFILDLAPALPRLSEIKKWESGKVTAKLMPLGFIVQHELRHLHEICEDLLLIRYMIMPEHVHFLVKVKKDLPKDVTSYIALMKKNCSQAYWEKFPAMKETAMFEEGIKDVIIKDSRQMAAVKAYIDDNPRRRWIKTNFPEYFLDIRDIDAIGGRWHCMGNHLLLDHYDIHSARISSKFSAEELLAKKYAWLESIGTGGAIAGGFFSKAEKKVRDYAFENNGNIILLMRKPFPARYKPEGRWFDYCAKGKLLIIAPVEAFPTEMRERDICLRLNALGDAIAAKQFRLL